MLSAGSGAEIPLILGGISAALGLGSSINEAVGGPKLLSQVMGGVGSAANLAGAGVGMAGGGKGGEVPSQPPGQASPGMATAPSSFGSLSGQGQYFKDAVSDSLARGVSAPGMPELLSPSSILESTALSKTLSNQALTPNFSVPGRGGLSDTMRGVLAQPLQTSSVPPALVPSMESLQVSTPAAGSSSTGDPLLDLIRAEMEKKRKDALYSSMFSGGLNTLGNVLSNINRPSVDQYAGSRLQRLSR